MPAQIVTQRELNRTHIQRQHLLQRASISTGDMLSALVGLQGQVTKDPYLALWSRIQGFRHDDLSVLLESRAAVRASLMRGTIHVVTAADFAAIFPVTYQLHARALPNLAYGKQVPADQVGPILASSREFLTGNPSSLKSLADHLLLEWPEIDPRAIGQVGRFLLPLVQIPPRGVWGKSLTATWSLASEWLGVEIEENIGPAHEIIRRYLRAFGPASLPDISVWSGVTNLKQAVIALADELVTYKNEAGVVLYDLAGLEITPADTPAPVRFLPGFDNALLGHKDRRRIISDEHRIRIGTRNGMFASTFLVGGYVAGSWKTTATALELNAFAPLTPTQRRDVENEAAKVAVFWTESELPLVWIEA